MRNKQIAGIAAGIFLTILFCGSAFAAPETEAVTTPETEAVTALETETVTASETEAVTALETETVTASETETTEDPGMDAAVDEVQGEVFVSPDFNWDDEDQGDFTVSFTIVNGSNMVIPETEVQITLPETEGHLYFDGNPVFSGGEPEGGSLSISGDRILRMELAEFPVGAEYRVSAAGRAEGIPEAGETGENELSETGNVETSAGEPEIGVTESEETETGEAETGEAPEVRFSPGDMHVSLVLRGYGEEHATALDYHLPDLLREAEEQPPAETPQEPQILSLLAATLTGTGREGVTADIVEGPLSQAMVFMNKNDEYGMNNIHFLMDADADGSAEHPFTWTKLVPVFTAVMALFVLYFLFCTWNVRRRASLYRFDPLSKTHEK